MLPLEAALVDEDESEEAPGRWSGGRSAVRTGEQGPFDLDRPAAGPEDLRDPSDPLGVADDGRLSVERHVESGQSGREGAPRIAAQVTGFPGRHAAVEVEIALVPHGSDTRGVRSPIAPDRPEEEGDARTE